MRRSIPSFAQAGFVEFVSAHAAKGDEDAARLLSRLPTHGPRKHLAPGKSRDERRQERNERAAQIRRRVFARAGAKEADGSDGRCEWDARGFMVLQWHHLVGGGSRTSPETEREDLTTAICHDCHRGWERSDPVVLRNAYAWALRLGFRDAAHEIEKKIAKVDEARRASPTRSEP